MKNKNSTLNLSFCIIFLLAVASVKAQNNAVIEGYIKSEADEPIDLVAVFLDSIQVGTTTNTDGYFRLADIPTGNHVLLISALGYETITRHIVVTDNQNQRQDFVLIWAPVTLKDITIKGGALKTRNRTATVNTVPMIDIQNLYFTKTQRIVEEVPGVEIANYSQGGTASTFSMRGFGSGGHGGDVAVQIDGISLNESEGHDDGYADMNVIIPLNLSKMDIHKGPSSVLFGNFANGGSIAFETRKGGEYTDLALQGGSYETVDAQIAVGQPFRLTDEKELRTNFAAQVYRSKGFMENNEYLKGNISGRIGYNLSDNTDLALTIKGHASDWDAPGYIPGGSSVEGGNQFFNKDRYKQAMNAENDGGRKIFSSERLDFNHTFNQNLRLLVYGYSVQQTFTRYGKFGLGEGGQSEDLNDRKVYSVGTSLNGTGKVGTMDVDWVVGTELYNEFTLKKNWETSDRVRLQDAPDEDRTYRVQTYSAFAQTDFDISRYFRPSVGLRFDNFDGSLKFHDPGELFHSADLNTQSSISPKLGFRSTLAENFDFRSNLSNGFTLPSGVTRYDPSMDVDPVKLWQYEIGFSYDYASWLKLDLVGYILNSSSEINEVAPGSGEFVNSGKTQRRGIEFSVKANPISELQLNGNFAYVKTEILENPDQSMIGLQISGIPASVTNFSTEYTFHSGFGLRYRFKDVGKYYTGGDNISSYGGYSVSNVEVYYETGIVNDRRARIHVELNNIFNKNYATVVFNSFGPEGGQSYTPAPGRNFMIGINYSL